jgi:DNA (cytosine-5)-methyltransferase 1
MKQDQFTFAEFFSGGGLVRSGLGEGWVARFANDIDPKKCRAYRQNFGDECLFEGDIADVSVDFLNQDIDLYWASSPCQDFSLAGHRRGLNGQRSSAFFPWISLVKQAVTLGFGPKIIAFENVSGLISSNSGADFRAVIASFQDLGYRVGALEIDAKLFLPQSRQRMFVVAVRSDIDLGHAPIGRSPKLPFHSDRLVNFTKTLSQKEIENWIWWDIDAGLQPKVALADCLEKDVSEGWLPKQEVARYFSMMSPLHQQRIRDIQAQGQSVVGTIYKRGRADETGQIRQRVEVRLDGLAGCLRTPGGGSSRQTVAFVTPKETRMRLLTAREAARLMGIHDSYVLPNAYNEAYKISGDGVAVPVVRYLAASIFEPVLCAPKVILAA